MRAVGLAVLICALALSGEAFARMGQVRGGEDKECYQSGVAYKQGDYCYTDCAPTAACDSKRASPAASGWTSGRASSATVVRFAELRG